MIRLLAVVALGLALVACGEREQVVQGDAGGAKRSYQGKTDAKPWDSEPLAYGSGKWSKGDRASWETQIKSRQQAQNEDKRIYQ